MATSSKSPSKQTPKKVQRPVPAAEAAASKKRPMPAAPLPTRPEVLAFTRINYLLLIGGILLLVVGFLLMSVGDFVDATQFSVALHIAPIVVMAGFIEVIFAIMYRPKQDAILSSGEAV